MTIFPYIHYFQVVLSFTQWVLDAISNRLEVGDQVISIEIDGSPFVGHPLSSPTNVLLSQLDVFPSFRNYSLCASINRGTFALIEKNLTPSFVLGLTRPPGQHC